MSTDDESKPYSVGKGKTPRHSRWRKGVSGNPSGKKKGALNLKSAWEKVLQQPVTITENGGKRTISKFEAMLMRLVENGMKGDHRAIGLILDRSERLVDSASEQVLETSEDDLAILQRVMNESRRGSAMGAEDQHADAAEGEDD